MGLDSYFLLNTIDAILHTKVTFDLLKASIYDIYSELSQKQDLHLSPLVRNSTQGYLQWAFSFSTASQLVSLYRNTTITTPSAAGKRTVNISASAPFSGLSLTFPLRDISRGN